jgi:hypothetical protein
MAAQAVVLVVAILILIAKMLLAAVLAVRELLVKVMLVAGQTDFTKAAVLVAVLEQQAQMVELALVQLVALVLLLQ